MSRTSYGRLIMTAICVLLFTSSAPFTLSVGADELMTRSEDARQGEDCNIEEAERQIFVAEEVSNSIQVVGSNNDMDSISLSPSDPAPDAPSDAEPSLPTDPAPETPVPGEEGEEAPTGPEEGGEEGEAPEEIDELDGPEEGEGDAEDGAPSGGLVRDEGGLRWSNGDGTWAASEWVEHDGATYYFGADGYAARWEAEIGGERYYFDGDCRMVTGWVTWKADGRRSYFDPETGAALRWEQVVGGRRYYFDGKCRMVTGWVTWNADSARSYFGADGAALSGWQDVEGERYYFDPENGCRGARWEAVIGGKRYYFDGKCRMVTGLVEWRADGLKSYFDPATGAAVSGWRDVDGARYYFSPEDGRSLRWLQEVGGEAYYFDGKCRMVTGPVKWNAGGWSLFGVDGKKQAPGWRDYGGETYYVGDDGYLLQWQQEIGGRTYYFDGKCRMHTGWLTWRADSTRSYFGSNGTILSGWQTIGGERYYFDPSNSNHGARWLTTIGGKRYYFESDCSMHTGWLQWKADGKWSYFGSDGVMYTGTHTIDGVSYTFDKNGKTDIVLNRTQLLSRLDSMSGSSGLTSFGTSYSFTSSAGKKLKSAVNSIRASYSLGFVMMDLKTGVGVCSSPSRSFYVASSLKGPYVVAINKYNSGSVTSYWKNVMESTITVSSNEGYSALRNRFGSSPMASFMSYTGVSGRWSAGSSYPYVTARDLAKLWVGNYWYFHKETNKNSSWCRSIFTHSLNSPIYNALRGKYTTYSKPGWYPMSPYWVQNDAGVVMAGDHPYLIVILSSACGQYSKLQTLVNALDAVHAEMV